MGLDCDLTRCDLGKLGSSVTVAPKWMVTTQLGPGTELQATGSGCTLSKNWDAELGPVGVNVEVRGQCTWEGRVSVSGGCGYKEALL